MKGRIINEHIWDAGYWGLMGALIYFVLNVLL